MYTKLDYSHSNTEVLKTWRIINPEPYLLVFHQILLTVSKENFVHRYLMKEQQNTAGK